MFLLTGNAKLAPYSWMLMWVPADNGCCLCFQLLKASPVTMMVNERSLAEVLKLKVSGPDGNSLHILQSNSPIFFKFAARMTDEDCRFLSPIIDSLVHAYQYLEGFGTHGTSAHIPSAGEDDLVIIPKLPRVYQRGLYSMDKSKVRLRLELFFEEIIFLVASGCSIIMVT